MRFFLGICLLLISSVSYGQNTVDTSFYVVANKYYQVNVAGFSAMSIPIPKDGFTAQSIVLGKDTFLFENDPHSNFSALIEIENNIETGYLYSGSFSGIITSTFLSVPSLNDRQKAVRAALDPCLPEVIPVSTWRQGLAAPSYTPSKTNTSHIIVHHAASSNADKDPFQTVRNIYVQHTQVNGWSDIGYNFLIGRDGTVFQGRDSKGLFDYDYVVGAHMCGRNQGTMGICLLGNYVSEEPTVAALQSLQKLIAWKSAKDAIDVFGSGIHQIGPAASGMPDAQLNYVAGHREGCKPGYTECPGDALFALLPKIKENSMDIQVHACDDDDDDDDDDTDSTDEQEVEYVLFPNPANSYFETTFDYDSLIVYDLSGKVLLKQKVSSDKKVYLPTMSMGLYICHFFIENRNRYHRLVVNQYY
jgi:hypothetical protein